MNVFFKSAAVVAVAALFPMVGSAQQGESQAPPPPGGGRGMARAEMARQMPAQRQRGPQLTNEQREQIRTFDEQQRTAGEAARRELGDLRRQINEALTAPQIDNSKVNQLRSAIVQRETALAQQRLERLAKAASVLTAEQRQSLGGRGLGEVFGPGGVAGPGIGPRQRRGAEMQMRGRMLQRQPRGGTGRGGARGGVMLRERADDARLRAEIRRLEVQLDALRRRIGR